MRTIRLLAALVALSLFTTTLHAQTDGTCVPISERGGRKLGCFITARHELGRLVTRAPLYWHLERYESLASAQRGAKRDNRSIAVESFGEHWVFTIAPSEWRSKLGKPFARVGPIPLVDATRFAAVYMEGVFEPGMHSMVHRHDGAEAWITLEGSQCLETSPESSSSAPAIPASSCPPGSR